MTTFVDTSALLAVLDADDLNYVRGKASWLELLALNEELLCTNYVLVELIALAQRRLGLQAVRDFQRDALPVLHVEWIDAVQHDHSVEAMLAANRRQLSLVDWVSFETMRRLKIENAFTFDPDFTQQGFKSIPA
jgi:predicted nucleic acid-binding protein